MTLQLRSRKILVHGDHNLAKLFPMWGEGEALYIWAERGLICWEDGRTDIGEYSTMSWETAANRVLALSEMVVRSSEDRKWAKERVALQNFIIKMEEVIRQARDQGSPFDFGHTPRSIARKRKQTVIRPRKVDRVVKGDDFLREG